MRALFFLLYFFTSGANALAQSTASDQDIAEFFTHSTPMVVTFILSVTAIKITALVIGYQIDIARERGRSVNPAQTRFIQRALNEVMNAGLKEDGFRGCRGSEAKVFSDQPRLKARWCIWQKYEGRTSAFVR